MQDSLKLDNIHMHPKIMISQFIAYNCVFYVLLKIKLKIKDTLLLPKPLKTIMQVDARQNGAHLEALHPGNWVGQQRWPSG